MVAIAKQMRVGSVSQQNNHSLLLLFECSTYICCVTMYEAIVNFSLFLKPEDFRTFTSAVIDAKVSHQLLHT